MVIFTFQHKEVLPTLWDNLIRSGVIIVGDRDSLHPMYDGAGKACRGFCQSVDILVVIIHKKLGIIRKPL